MQVADPTAIGQESASNSPPKPRIPYFNRENARAMAARALEKRRSNKIERDLRALQAEQEATKPNQDKRSEPENQYQADRLLRVRKQLDLIDKRIRELCELKRPDGQTLNWLCSAQERLSEQERKLAMRPTPAPVKQASRRRESSHVEPLDAQ